MVAVVATQEPSGYLSLRSRVELLDCSAWCGGERHMDADSDGECFDFARLADDDPHFSHAEKRSRQPMVMDVNESTSKESKTSADSSPASLPSLSSAGAGGERRDCNTWASWVRDHFAEEFRGRGPQQKAVLIDSICTGMATHSLGLQVPLAMFPLSFFSLSLQCCSSEASRDEGCLHKFSIFQ